MMTKGSHRFAHVTNESKKELCTVTFSAMSW